MADDVLAALKSHPDFGKRVFWHTALDDQALLTLYRHAFASVLPSHYEGYGLPVVEALSQACVTVASDAGLEVCWIPLLPPDKPGLYAFASMPRSTRAPASKRGACSRWLPAKGPYDQGG
jgi:hypothetical protein